jgi:ribonuclease D
LVGNVAKNADFYVSSQAHLDRVVALIEERKIVALDTEFTRENTYYPILSIIQVAVKNSANVKQSFIIDCLCGLDLSDFFKVIADKKITKILHACSQDLQIFHRQSKLMPEGIIDTQILANFCGVGFNVGYSNLVKNFFGKELNKNQQRSDWQRRPLSESQIKYALLDVFFLEEVYEKLMADLSAKNRLSWYREEIKNFTAKVVSQPEENLFKKFSYRGKNPKQIAQIQKLVLWRESWARKLDIPRQHLLRDEQLENLVIYELSDVNLGRRINREMLSEIKEILLQNDEVIHEKKTLSARQKIIVEKAKKLVARICAETNFREQFLITNFDLKRIVSDNSNIKEIVTGWRYEVVGCELENLINNS